VDTMFVVKNTITVKLGGPCNNCSVCKAKYCVKDVEGGPSSSYSLLTAKTYIR
jgi:hypothetical protein